MMARSAHSISEDPKPGQNVRAELAMQLSDLWVRELPDRQFADTADECLVYLAKTAEERVRQMMALKLADCAWAPPRIVRHLAFDAMSIAEPILKRCLSLDEDTLIELARTTRERRLAIADRRFVSEPLTRELASHREKDVINTLARNAGAELGTASGKDFAVVSEGDVDLQAALASRDDLTSGFAAALLNIAADEIAARLQRRFPELPKRKLSELAQSASEESIDTTTDEGAARLTLQLHSKGQLNAPFALRSLEEGKANLFDHSIARLSGLPVRDWRRALGTSPLRACGLAARTIAVDAASVIPIVESLTLLGRIHPVETPLIRRAAAEIFAEYGRDDARKALHRLGADGVIG